MRGARSTPQINVDRVLTNAAARTPEKGMHFGLLIRRMQLKDLSVRSRSVHFARRQQSFSKTYGFAKTVTESVTTGHRRDRFDSRERPAKAWTCERC